MSETLEHWNYIIEDPYKVIFDTWDQGQKRNTRQAIRKKPAARYKQYLVRTRLHTRRISASPPNQGMADLNSWRQEATLTLFSRWGSERRKIWPPSCCYPSWCSLSSWGSACTGKSRAAAPSASRSRQRWVAPRSVWRRRMSSAPLGCMSPTMPSELGRVEAQWWRGRRLRPSWWHWRNCRQVFGWWRIGG